MQRGQGVLDCWGALPDWVCCCCCCCFFSDFAPEFITVLPERITDTIAEQAIYSAVQLWGELTSLPALLQVTNPVFSPFIQAVHWKFHTRANRKIAQDADLLRQVVAWLALFLHGFANASQPVCHALKHSCRSTNPLIETADIFELFTVKSCPNATVEGSFVNVEIIQCQSTSLKLIISQHLEKITSMASVWPSLCGWQELYG